MTVAIHFDPWREFRARKESDAMQRWLKGIGEAGVNAFRSGMGNYPPASSPGAWPNSRTGRLKASIRSEVHGNTLTIGTSMRYSIFLREGTSRMARRRMSDDAMKAGIAAGSRLGHWVEWSFL